jgi:hypothetical protein
MKAGKSPKGAGKPKGKPASKRPRVLIFRRYRTTKSGKVLDAHDYGHDAWPMWV